MPLYAPTIVDASALLVPAVPLSAALAAATLVDGAIVALPSLPLIIALPAPATWLAHKYYLDARGLYRIFNAAKYRIYLSAIPSVEGDAPWATSATLPATPPIAVADGTYYLSLSYFNGVLDSGFLPIGPLGETFLTLVVDSGVISKAPPNGPINWHLELLPAGVVRVIGLGMQLDEDAPDQWAVFYTVDGGASSEIDATFAKPFSVLDCLLTAQANGAVVSVTLRTRRNDGTDNSPAWTYSVAGAAKTLTVDSVGPTAPLGGDTYPGPIPDTVEA